jgi:integrase
MAGAVNDYLGAIAAKGFSPYTVSYRSRSLAHLVAWLAERGVSHPAEVTKPVLERYQRSLFHYRKADGAPLSFRTQVSYLVPVKGLFRWLAQTNRILFNPASELEMPRIERRLPRVVLNVGEVEAVLATADLDDPVGVRDRAIMEVLYSTGMRRSELAHLRLHDVDVDRGTVVIVQGKGRRDRMVPIGERALAWVPRPRRPPRCGCGVPHRGGQRHDPGPSHRPHRPLRAHRDEQAGIVPHVSSHHGDVDARRRRGHPPHPGDARPRAAVHHRDLHPRLDRRVEGRAH